MGQFYENITPSWYGAGNQALGEKIRTLEQKWNQNDWGARYE